jgi:heat-inducible transcriptional repressor
MRPAGRDREQQVLEALIQLYIERREPVSSRMLERSGRLDIRSASIRSVLHELEKKGYLNQPHSSAGRLPTDEGYRAYVNSLLDESAVDPAELVTIQQALREAGEDLELLLRGMARVLSRFSENIAILAGPQSRSPIVTGVDIYQRDSTKVLVVVTLDSRAVRTELVDLGRPLHAESLVAASTFLAERLAGRTLEEIRGDVDAMLRVPEVEGADVLVEVAAKARSLFDPDGVLQLTFEGVPEALEQPEFADPARLRALLEVMSRAKDFQLSLEAFVGPSSGEISLAIGRENALPLLHPFSLLATRFELDDQYGYLAILGPQRMRYARCLALIRLITSHLERLRA